MHPCIDSAVLQEEADHADGCPDSECMPEFRTFLESGKIICGRAVFEIDDVNELC